MTYKLKKYKRIILSLYTKLYYIHSRQLRDVLDIADNKLCRDKTYTEYCVVGFLLTLFHLSCIVTIVCIGIQPHTNSTDGSQLPKTCLYNFVVFANPKTKKI